jgi:serine/threonine protein kinase
MTQHCPVCQRSFAEPGFCPFDGTQLVVKAAAPDQATVMSSVHRAQSDADTQHEQDNRLITKPGLGEATHKLLAISAHEGHADAIDTIRKRVSEYDRLVGETLDGRYYVQRKIGEGGMGVVFAVKHAVIERPLAIKVLKRDVMRDGAVIQRFIQEAKAASRIGHPNIVDVTDFGKTPDGMTYSVMEFVDGTTLSKVIKSVAPLPPERAVRIASQIARALAAAHAKGIVHRDLKPENVFLIDRDGRPDFVKIVDFGIAKVQPVEGTQDPTAPRLTRAGAVFGTPEYMSPEQASGRGDTDHRVDIYALGVIMYEMLVGKVPHKGDSMIRTIAMQMLEPITPPNEVNPDLNLPSALVAIVMKALEKKREDRYESMNALLAVLDDVANKLALGINQLSLPPLPPGADLDITPAPGVKIVGGATAGGADAATSRRIKPPTRPLHEPEFVAPGAPMSFSHVYDSVEPPPERRRWPLWLAGLLVLLVGAGGTILLIAKLRGDRDEPVIVAVRDDAAVIVADESRDAGIVDVPVDAADVIADVPADAGIKVTVPARRDAGVPVTRPGKRMVTIEIMTRPGEANVYIEPNFRGPSGVNITEPYGTKRHIECKTDTLKGHVDVVFDGSRPSVMCTVSRPRYCAPGLKPAPGIDCEENPVGGP